MKYLSSQSQRRMRCALAIFMLLAGAMCAAATWAAADLPIAPDWTLDGVDGTTVKFHDDARGRPAVLFFWASWCPHCRTTLPYMEALHAEFAPRGVRFYALDIWEDGDAVAYFKRHGYHLPLFLAADLVAEEYGIEGTPGIVLVDRQLRIQPLAIDDAEPQVIAAALRTQLLRHIAPAVTSAQ